MNEYDTIKFQITSHDSEGNDQPDLCAIASLLSQYVERIDALEEELSQLKSWLGVKGK